MDIKTAVKKAIENKCGITRASMLSHAVVIPIHEKEPFYLYIKEKNGSRIPNWNPTPEDILADDWEVTKV